MTKLLTVFINDQSVFAYDRETRLEDSQLQFLDKMDSDMARGIKIKGELIDKPDHEQRIRFVVLNLINALRQDDNAKIAALCAYITQRRPALQEIHAKDQGDSVVIDMIDENMS